MNEHNKRSPTGWGGCPGIDVVGLTKRYGPTLAVEDLSFAVAPGRVVGFLGPNGAGKTTTFRSLLGLVRPTSGGALIGGFAYRELDDPVRTVGALLDAGAAHPGRSGRDHLRIHARAAGISQRRVEDLLELVGLEPAAGRRVSGYSLGMRQRLGLATALLGDPQVLVLDEPANGLDPEGVRWLRDLLRSFADDGRAVLVSSHVLAEVAQSADEVVVINEGRSVLQARLDDLLAKHRTGLRVAGPDAGTLAGLFGSTGASVVPDGPSTVVIKGCSQEEVLRAVAEHQLSVNEVTTLGSSLEDIYLELVGDCTGGTR